ncbi:MAG: hypothetical protein M1840_007256 [Geoglossum simile]|nr:MAG: hypothetical protein M1840_007256 [Geoglossum simile]
MRLVDRIPLVCTLEPTAVNLATLVEYGMAAAPSAFDRSQDANDDFLSEDEDAEHEDDPMMDQIDHMDQMDQTVLGGGFYDIGHGAELSDIDAEHDEIDEEDEDDHEPVGAVKLPDHDSEDGIDDDQDDADSVEVESCDDSDESDKDSSDADSDIEREWEEASNDREEEETEAANPNHCIFCYEDEENDPSEEYEEYLACEVCGDSSHRQCARSNNALKSEEDAQQWRCPNCVANALRPDREHDTGSTSRRRTSAQITRDLLPSQRGNSRPNSHSVFNQLIVNDDPMDGSRLLRKRKASTDDVEAPTSTNATRKRKRTDSDSESDPNSNTPISSPQENEPEDEDGDNDGGNEEEIQAEKEEKDEERESRLEATTAVRNLSGSPVSRPRPSRPRRPKPLKKVLVTVAKKTRNSFVLSFKLDRSKVEDILTRHPKPRRQRRPERRSGRPSIPATPATVPFSSTYSSSYATQFYSFHERENDELKSKPYGGILSETDADTSKTFPQTIDRDRFEDAKQRAEEEWKLRAATASGSLGMNGDSNDHGSHKVSGPASKIQCINFGGYEIDTWYAAPYPEEYSRNRVLYICEFCLKYMNSEYVAWRHKLKCPAKHPPGDEIYRDGSVSVFEVDGRKNPVYCQNLCLLAKLFLGSKTLYYDVEPFLFYVMTEYDELGCHFVGYFSKEKRPSSQNNVSCILTLPIHQRKGYGNLLIDFSYLLTRVERKTGSPEKPLSDMGLVSYRNYWRLVLCYQLNSQSRPLSITDISDRTGMTADDIVSALEGLRALVRDPATGAYALRLDYEYFRSYITKWEAKGYIRLNPECLVWTPYIMGRSSLSQFNQAPALTTVAAREEEDVEAEDSGQISVIKVNGSGGSKSAGSGTPIPDGTPAREMDVNSPSNFTTPTNEIERQFTSESTTVTLRPTTPLPNSNRRNPSTADSGKFKSVMSSNNNSILKTPSIPPTRFEIFPPLPGSRRRAGRPTASTRRRTTSSTPAVRRKDTRHVVSAKSPSGSRGKSPKQIMPSGKTPLSALGKVLRRTRSKMAETMSVSGNEEDGEDMEKREEGGGGKYGNNNGLVARRADSPSAAYASADGEGDTVALIPDELADEERIRVASEPTTVRVDG